MVTLTFLSCTVVLDNSCFLQQLINDVLFHYVTNSTVNQWEPDFKFSRINDFFSITKCVSCAISITSLCYELAIGLQFDSCTSEYRTIRGGEKSEPLGIAIIATESVPKS